MTIGADARGWTPEATLGEGESHLVKANAVDPKLWKVRESCRAQDIRWK